MPGNDPYKNFNFNVDVDGKPVVADPPPPKKESATTKRSSGFFQKLRDWLGFARR